MPSFRQDLATLESWADHPGLERVEHDRPVAALTFDDGPDPEGTPAVLDALDQAGATATFFVVGEQLLRHNALARETLDRGHEVALHCYTHVRHEELSPTQARDDVARGVGALEAATGRPPRWCRPPYGRFSEASFAACERLSLEPVYWSAWGLDWETVAAARIGELVGRDLVPGAIVLLHDSARYGARPSAAPTAEAVPLIAELAAERGVALRSLAEAT